MAPSRGIGSFLAGVGNLNLPVVPPGDVLGDGNFGLGRGIGVRRGTGNTTFLEALPVELVVLVVRGGARRVGEDGGVKRETEFGRGGWRDDTTGVAENECDGSAVIVTGWDD